MVKSITQEEPMGCGIACVAFALRKSYKTTKKLFDNPQYSQSRGYYCKELVEVLNKNGLNYSFKKFKEKYKSLLKKEGTIIFVKRSKKYPLGHYLIKTKRGWMNSRINFPNISPTKSGFQKKHPKEAQWIIYPTS